jgi:serine/threonine-protein kinase HipA
MECGDAGRFANAKNLLSQSARFLLDPLQAAQMLDAIEAQVQRTWYATARAVGVSARDCEKIKSAFAYPGFRQQAQAASI